MTEQQQHHITPPPELRAKWTTEALFQDYCSVTEQVTDRAAQWGYEQRGEVNETELQQARDQELAACNNWLVLNGYGEVASRLYDALRPKPPTRAEIALDQYDRCVSILKEKGYSPAGCIRDALVRLKQLEDSND